MELLIRKHISSEEHLISTEHKHVDAEVWFDWVKGISDK